MMDTQYEKCNYMPCESLKFESNYEVVKKSKKRSRNPESWIKSKRKEAILSGQTYINTRGEKVSPKKMGPDCNCQKKCFAEVDEEARRTIFNGFYSLKRLGLQCYSRIY